MEITSYFHLNEQPFRISPDPRFLYLSDQVKEALAKVEYMTRERIGPLYMYGPIGSGKTSILRRLHAQLHENESINVQLLITPNIRTANGFLRMIMEHYDVPTDRSYTQSLDNFQNFLFEQHKSNITPVLLVDESQNMNRDLLKLVHFLLNFETNTTKLLQIVLAGQEELGPKITRYQELSSRMFPIAMNVMSMNDLKDMLEFRWYVAGGKDSPFTEGAYRELFVYSKGLPRDAVKMAEEILRELFLSKRQQADGSDVQQIAKSLNLTE